MNSIIPKFIFDEEDIIYLKDKGIQIQEGTQIIGKYKVPCYKFLNLDENEVFDELRNPLNESTETENAGYANRVVSILFLRFRQVQQIKDHDQKVAAACALIGAVNSLASIHMRYAQRFLPLLRSIV